MNFREPAAVSFFTRKPRRDKRAHDVERELDATGLGLRQELTAEVSVLAGEGQPLRRLLLGDLRQGAYYFIDWFSKNTLTWAAGGQVPARNDVRAWGKNVGNLSRTSDDLTPSL